MRSGRSGSFLYAPISVHSTATDVTRLLSTGMPSRLDTQLSMYDHGGWIRPASEPPGGGSSWIYVCPEIRTRLQCFLRHQRSQSLAASQARLAAYVPASEPSAQSEPTQHVCEFTVSAA